MAEIKEHGELRDPELEGLVLLVDVDKPGAGPILNHAFVGFPKATSKASYDGSYAVKEGT